MCNFIVSTLNIAHTQYTLHKCTVRTVVYVVFGNKEDTQFCKSVGIKL